MLTLYTADGILQRSKALWRVIARLSVIARLRLSLGNITRGFGLGKEEWGWV